MHKLILTTSIFWLTAASFLSSAQNAKDETVYTETVELHTNTTFLVTGETLYYSIHCLGPERNKYSRLSKLVYVELIGENEKPVLQTKVPLKEGRGSGDFFLSSTLPSGNYSLIAYTRWMRNFGVENFFQQQITIINPYVKPVTETQPGITKPPKSTTSFTPGVANETKQVQIASDKKTYLPRQKVIVTLKNNDPTQECYLFINVRQHDSFSKSRSTNNAGPTAEGLAKKEFIQFLPDLRGETIGGVVKESSTGRPVKNSNIYLTVPGSTYTFQISRTDSTGRFNFSTKNIHTENGIQFQLDQQSNVEIILDGEFIKDYKSFTPQPLSIDTSMRKQIEQRNVYGQIENAYFIKKRDSILSLTREPFFDKGDKIYRLDDFTRFPTMEDIFREFMYEVVVSKRDGKFLLRLINTTTKNGARFLNTPLIIMDGVPVFDTEVLMSYNPLLINTVSIITRPYVYGGILYDGVLAVSTYTGNAKELNVNPIRKDYTSWQYPKKYYSPEYNTPESLTRVPDYRVQLFWNPALTLAPGQEWIGEFYTSDVEGNFLMEIKGFNTKGELINAHKIIEVQK